MTVSENARAGANGGGFRPLRTRRGLEQRAERPALGRGGRLAEFKRFFGDDARRRRIVTLVVTLVVTLADALAATAACAFIAEAAMPSSAALPSDTVLASSGSLSTSSAPAPNAASLSSNASLSRASSSRARAISSEARRWFKDVSCESLASSAATLSARLCARSRSADSSAALSS